LFVWKKERIHFRILRQEQEEGRGEEKEEEEEEGGSRKAGGGRRAEEEERKREKKRCQVGPFFQVPFSPSFLPLAAVFCCQPGNFFYFYFYFWMAFSGSNVGYVT